MLKKHECRSRGRTVLSAGRKSVEAVVWKRDLRGAGGVVLVVAMVLRSCLDHRKDSRKKTTGTEDQGQMMTDYPDILNKFTLLLNAGMNTRKAFTKVAPRLQKVDKRAGEKSPRRGRLTRQSRPSARRWSKLECRRRSVSHLGVRCQLPAYRTFAALRFQNLRRGSGKFWRSWSVRRWMHLKTGNAGLKVIGEQAGTRLPLPMVLMLVIVFVVLLVPAGMSFL